MKKRHVIGVAIVGTLTLVSGVSASPQQAAEVQPPRVIKSLLPSRSRAHRPAARNKAGRRQR